MSKFIHCHPANGMMWCQHPNRSWAPPFPLLRNDSGGSVPVDKVEEDDLVVKKKNRVGRGSSKKS